jgi:hypothetical protein
MKTRRQPAQKPATHEERMLRAAGAYLTERGWSVAVISANRVQRQPDALAGNYEFVIKFTGTRHAPVGAETGTVEA